MKNLKEPPLISVVIPTHNRAEALGRALDSVYSQKGVGEIFRIEAIVVDDASGDKTKEVAARYTGLRYIRLPKNVGASAARNLGIKASSGEYIAFLDDDDLWLPHRLLVQVPVMENKKQLGVVYGQGYISGDGFSDMIWPDARWGVSGRVFEFFLTQDTEDVFNIDTVLIRRQAFDKTGYFDESLKTMEHHDLMLRLAFHFPFEFIPGPVSKGYASNNGLFVTSIAEGIYEQSYCGIVERAVGLLPESDRYVELRRKATIKAFSVVAGVHWQYGFTERLRRFILKTIQKFPWMIEEAAMLSNLYRLVRRMATGSRVPERLIRELCDDLRSAARARGFRQTFRMNRLRADLSAEAAVMLLKKDGIAASKGLLFDSISHDPSRLGYRLFKNLKMRLRAANKS